MVFYLHQICTICHMQEIRERYMKTGVFGQLFPPNPVSAKLSFCKAMRFSNISVTRQISFNRGVVPIVSRSRHLRVFIKYIGSLQNCSSFWFCPIYWRHANFHCDLAYTSIFIQTIGDPSAFFAALLLSEILWAHNLALCLCVFGTHGRTHTISGS